MPKITDKTIDYCLAGMEIDRQPFNDIYRAIGFVDAVFMNPTESELKTTLDLIRILLTDYNVVCLKGPEMKPLANNIDQTIKELERITTTQKFEDYYYGIWFDRRP